MLFGISSEDLEYINKVIFKHNEIDKAVIFGSRVMDNYKKVSDIDIALFGENINSNIMFKIKEELNEISLLPYFFDIVHYEKIQNIELKKHIDDKGIKL